MKAHYTTAPSEAGLERTDRIAQSGRGRQSFEFPGSGNYARGESERRRDAYFPGTVEVFFEYQKHRSSLGELCTEPDGHPIGSGGFCSTSDGTFSHPTKMTSLPHSLFSRPDAVRCGSDGLFAVGDGLLSAREATLSASDQVFSALKMARPIPIKACPSGTKSKLTQIKVTPPRKSREVGGKKAVPRGPMPILRGEPLVRVGQGSFGVGQKSVGAPKNVTQSVPPVMQRRFPQSQPAASRKLAPALPPNHSRDGLCHFPQS